jgi:hypothetical protein
MSNKIVITIDGVKVAGQGYIFPVFVMLRGWNRREAAAYVL